jgi:hypothetical protein
VDNPWRTAAFCILGTAQAAVYFTIAAWDGYYDRPSAAMALALLAFLFYLAAIASARGLSSRTAVGLAVALGLLFRGLLLPEPPFFSDDYFRYLWDGLVQLRGINPYRYAPADPTLAGIDDALRAKVNHPEVRTIYPPLAQVLFAVSAAISQKSWIVLKSAWLLCDLGIALVLFRLVEPARRLQLWTLYWWSPLVIVEVTWNAHLDLLGVLPLVLALWLARASPARSAALGIAIASAALVKYFAAAFIPAATRSGRAGRTLTAFALMILLLHIPYAGAGKSMFEGLFTYAANWRFNDGLFQVLAWVTVSQRIARGTAAVLVLLVVFQSVRNEWSMERTVFWVTGAILMLSPTLHPWYLLWMVPLLSLRPSRAWLYLSGSVFLAYYGLGVYRTDGSWPEPWWVKLAVYGPFFALLIRDAWRDSWWQASWEILRTRT